MEDDVEKLKSGSSNPSSPLMTLQKAVDMGEYDPSYLSTFPEWNTLTKHIQFQYIKQAIANRHTQLLAQWSEVVNILNFSQKPHLQETLNNIQAQWKKLDQEKERLFTEYSNP